MSKLATSMARRATAATQKNARRKLKRAAKARKRAAVLKDAPKPKTYHGAQRLYNTPLYKEWRKYVFARDGYKCQLCGATKCKLEAHHIKPKRFFPELVLDKNNGVTLCKDCHHGIIGRKEHKFVYIFSVIVQVNTYKYTRERVKEEEQ